MPNKKNQSAVGTMIQRCHKWRQKRKQYIDQARQTSDEIERERLLQWAEHYCRMVNAEQGKIDTMRGPADKNSGADIAATDAADTTDATDGGDASDEDDAGFPDFIENLK